MFFFEKYFSKFSNDATIKKELAIAFCNPPFNLGFGSSLILDYRKSKLIYENIESLIGKCTDLKDFDV